MDSLERWSALRRQPLYPSELRARNTYIVASKAFASNISAIVHAVETDLMSAFIRFFDRASQVLSGRRDAKDAAPSGLEPAGSGARSCVKYGCARGFGGLDAANRNPRPIRAWITARRQNHAHRRPSFPRKRMPPQLAVRGRGKNRRQIGRHAVHQRLRLRIAQAHVE